MKKLHISLLVALFGVSCSIAVEEFHFGEAPKPQGAWGSGEMSLAEKMRISQQQEREAQESTKRATQERDKQSGKKGRQRGRRVDFSELGFRGPEEIVPVRTQSDAEQERIDAAHRSVADAAEQSGLNLGQAPGARQVGDRSVSSMLQEPQKVAEAHRKVAAAAEGDLAEMFGAPAQPQGQWADRTTLADKIRDSQETQAGWDALPGSDVYADDGMTERQRQRTERARSQHTEVMKELVARVQDLEVSKQQVRNQVQDLSRSIDLTGSQQQLIIDQVHENLQQIQGEEDPNQIMQQLAHTGNLEEKMSLAPQQEQQVQDLVKKNSKLQDFVDAFHRFERSRGGRATIIGITMLIAGLIVAGIVSSVSN